MGSAFPGRLSTRFVALCFDVEQDEGVVTKVVSAGLLRSGLWPGSFSRAIILLYDFFLFVVAWVTVGKHGSNYLM